MDMQIFGVKNDADTRKALRFFKERRIRVHFVDFKARGLSAHIAARRIIKSPIMFDQLIWYPAQDRLHISFAPGDRREVMTKPKGQPGYLPGLVLCT